jgi:hypothetical protein
MMLISEDTINDQDLRPSRQREDTINDQDLRPSRQRLQVDWSAVGRTNHVSKFHASN